MNPGTKRRNVMTATAICDVKINDPACEAILEFLTKHPRARFNRKALLTIGWLNASTRAEQVVDDLLAAGVVGWDEDSDLYYLAL
jgi:hypothetical protein